MSAILSPDGKYRYWLRRDVNVAHGPVFGFVGVNPSIADASRDDATVRKWRGFCAAWGASAFVVGNVFAFRSTDVRLLKTEQQPVGPENFAYLERLIRESDVIVPCWGDRAKIPRSLYPHIDRAASFLRVMSKEADKPIKCFGRTRGGDPLHPLMLAYSTELVDFE